MHLWRIAAGVLPTKESLCRFLPNIDISYPLCNACPESVVHIFWECDLAQALWMGIIGFRTDYFQLASASNLVEVVVFPNVEVVDDLLSSDIFTLKGTLILDLVWKARNSKVYDERSMEIGGIMNSFRSLWRDHSSILKVLGTISHISLGVEGWTRPKCGVIKINCDAVVGSRFSSIAAVARDWRGKLVFALSKKVNTVIPLQAEAKVILWAGQLAVSHGFPNVIIEYGCKACVDVVNALGSCPWLIQSVMFAVVDVLSDLIWWKLCWVRRNANRAPHAFAKWSHLHLS